MSMRKLCVVVLAALALTAGLAQADPVDLAVNGGFETGNFDGWLLFPSAPDQITIVTPGASGDYAACIDNMTPASGSVLKNANVGIGTVEAGQAVTIEFDARGAFAIGGVAFAEFFSEIDGGGVSASEILGGAPLAVNADPAVWTHFSFSTVTGPDVSGGVTVQFGAITGADPGSSAMLCVDNLTIVVDSVVPVETTTWSELKNSFR
ncbi:MAG: hypothetical protein R3D98_02210 [Candidatus Krumholzibacteriia bacterium]